VKQSGDLRAYDVDGDADDADQKGCQKLAPAGAGNVSIFVGHFLSSDLVSTYIPILTHVL
jgi:hypothetical protein